MPRVILVSEILFEVLKDGDMPIDAVVCTGLVPSTFEEIEREVKAYRRNAEFVIGDFDRLEAAVHAAFRDSLKCHDLSSLLYSGTELHVLTAELYELQRYDFWPQLQQLKGLPVVPRELSEFIVVQP